MPNIELETIANISYALMLASYIMRDILWLRVLTVVSFCFEIPYFYFRPDPLWDGIAWDVAFIAINVYWIGRLVYDRRPVHFTADQKRLWETALHRLHPRHARALFKIGKVKSVAPNETISTQGETLHDVALISEGKVELRIENKRIEELGPGNFIGTASFLERKLEFPSFATVVAAEPTLMITWNKRELRKLADRDHDLRMAIQATMGLEIANLLMKAWKRQALIK